MHELSITKSIINSIQTETKKNNLKKIKQAEIDLGNFNNYNGECIIYYYNILKKEQETLKDSQIKINTIKTIANCKNCKNQYEIIDPIITFCPKCESSNIIIIKGKELKLKNIEGI
jgi:hydrogenase nickel incorporation protein HypA/HybF